MFRCRAGQAAVEMAQFLYDRLVVGGQFEGPFHVPNGRFEFAALVVYIAQSDPGEHGLGIGAEHTAEHVGGLFVPTGFEHRFAQQPVGRHVFGILLQDMPPMGDGLLVAALFDHVFDLLAVFVKGDLIHCSLLLSLGLARFP